MKLTHAMIPAAIAGIVLSGCMATPAVRQQVAQKPPDILRVQEDGSMRFNDRPIPSDDVIIYGNGEVGERAAVRIRMEPLHPDFFRDTVVVVRE